MNAAAQLYREYESLNSGHADRIAFSFVDAQGRARQLTYAALFDRCTRIAQRLRDRARPGVVVILARRQEDQVVCVLAALAAGLVPAVMTPPNPRLNIAYYYETTRKVLHRVSPSVVITDFPDVVQSDTEHVARSYEVLTLDLDLVAPATGAQPKLSSDSTAFVQFSSGTTGVKKAVALGVDELMAQLESYTRALGIQGGEQGESGRDCIVNWLPLYHDMGYITSLHLALYRGVSSVLLDPLEWVTNPASWLAAVTEFRGTLSWNPNFAYAFLAARVNDQQLAAVDLGSLRALVNCSEPVTDRAQQNFLDRFEQVGVRPGVFAGCYAMAETTFALTHAQGTDLRGKDPTGPEESSSLAVRLPLVTVGAPLPEVQLEIRDPKGQPRADRLVGEIAVRAPFVAGGYLHNEEDTNNSFVDGWYLTGDLGYLSDGLLYVVGRRKDVLIIAGQNIFPEDVESIVGQSPGVVPGRAAAFAWFNASFQTDAITVLAEVRSNPKDVDLSTIRQQVLAELGVAINVQLVRAGWLIKSSSGKLSRAENARRWLDRSSGDDSWRPQVPDPAS